MEKDYNLGADVYPDFNHESVYGRVKDFKDKEEFKRYLIGEEYIEKDELDNLKISIVYMRYVPKGNFYSDGEPCWTGCEKGRGATQYYECQL